MTPDRLRQQLEERAPLQHWPDPTEPADLLTWLEDAVKSDPSLDELLPAAHDLATAEDGLPSIIQGIRRVSLIRVDRWTTTWDGVQSRDGTLVRLRTLRIGFLRDPVVRRWLARQAALVEHARGNDDETSFFTPVVGLPLADFADADEHASPVVLARMLATALAAHARAASMGIRFPALEACEYIETSAGLQLGCLTVSGGVSPSVQIRKLASHLQHWWNEGPQGPITSLLEGFQVFPPRDYTEAIDLTVAALSQQLADERHRLHHRSVKVRSDSRKFRLADLLSRLGSAIPAPAGRGAIGVDLEGRTTLVESDGRRISWGPLAETTDIVSPEGALDVKVARHLLRARAAAPPNARLQQEVGGSNLFVDQICQWISCQSHLRTLRLLLDAH